MVHVKLRHVGPGAPSFHLAPWLCLARKSSPAVTSNLAQALKSNTRASMPFVQYAFAVCSLYDSVNVFLEGQVAVSVNV